MSRQVLSRLVFVIALFAVFSVLAWAAPVNAPKYDKANEVKLKGTVEELTVVPGKDEGQHFLLKTSTGTILVHVAPEKFLKDIEVSFAKDEVVEVVGCKIVNSEGQNEVLAREISRNNNTLTLRDSKGEPVWLGWK